MRNTKYLRQIQKDTRTPQSFPCKDYWILATEPATASEWIIVVQYVLNNCMTISLIKPLSLSLSLPPPHPSIRKWHKKCVNLYLLRHFHCNIFLGTWNMIYVLRHLLYSGQPFSILQSFKCYLPFGHCNLCWAQELQVSMCWLFSFYTYVLSLK